MSGIRGLGLTAFLGERDSHRGRFLAERVVDELAGSGVEAGMLMRGVEGFGSKHLRRTDRLLTLSEDLPIAVSGVGDAESVERAASAIAELIGERPVTLHDVGLFAATDSIEDGQDWPPGPWARSTIHLGRGRRIAGRPAYEAVVTRLRAAGVEGATVLLGVDGVLGGRRHRAGFFSRNADVPAAIVSVGSLEAMARGLSSVRTLPGERIVTVEPAHVCKRAGSHLDPDPVIPRRDELIRLTLHSSEGVQVHGRPVHAEAVRALRAAGAAGATALRGTWGFDASHQPHGDRFAALRRRVPTMTVVIDGPLESRRWLDLLDELTPSHGLITSERLTPALSRR